MPDSQVSQWLTSLVRREPEIDEFADPTEDATSTPLETGEFAEAAEFEAASRPAQSWVTAEIEVSRATWQAYNILYFAFTALFFIAGLDKFVRVLTNWERFVPPRVAHPNVWLSGAGIVEIAIGAAIAVKPRVGAWAAAVWLGVMIGDAALWMGAWDLVLLLAMAGAAGVAFLRLAAECN